MAHQKNLFQRFTSFFQNYPIMILPYMGYGTSTELYLKGRVLRDKGITVATEKDSLWQNLINAYKRVGSNEIPFAKIRATFNDQIIEVVANREGFFDVLFKLTSPLEAHQHEIKLELVSDSIIQATAQLIIPPDTAQFGVISDLDDTVIQTDVLNILKMVRNTFLRNARTRLPFPGVAAFYRALQAGTNNTQNPIFYVSSSPWNLYDLIVDFFKLRGIPVGAIFLRDFSLFNTGHRAHKFEIIENLLITYAQLPFILIGDSGQRDPEIYTEAAKKYPDRIKAIYIRDVTSDVRRDRQVLKLAKEVFELGIDMRLVTDSYTAAQDAVKKGFILASTLPDIEEELIADNRPPDPVEDMVSASG